MFNFNLDNLTGTTTLVITDNGSNNDGLISNTVRLK